jgi:regulator of RNase E activity RraA
MTLPLPLPPGLSCASLVDAMGHRHTHRCHIVALTSPDPTRVLFGPAATIAFLPYRDDQAAAARGFAALFYEAVGTEPSGKVLVLSSGGYPDVSHAGGTKLSRLRNNDLGGLVADGRLRDFSELAAFPFATWCRGEAVRWGGDVVAPVAADVPVEVGGVTVCPGDYVYADSAGAVVIPAASVVPVLQEAAEIERADRTAVEQIRHEDPDEARDVGR